MQSLTTRQTISYEHWAIDEDGERIAMHPDAYIEPPCCSTAGSSGVVECGCGGRSSIVCPAEDCPGIQEHELEALLERLLEGKSI